jgi:hypothetical protein
MRLTMLFHQAVAWLQLHLREACYAVAGVLLVLQSIAAFVSPIGAWSLCVAAIACLVTANLDRIGSSQAPGEAQLLMKQARDSIEHVGQLLRMSVRARLEMIQRSPRREAHSDAEMEAALTESVGLLRAAGVADTEIATIREQAWDRWVRFDYVLYALGGSTSVSNPTIEIAREWSRIRAFGTNPTPDEVDAFLKRVGCFEGLWKDLAEGFRYYAQHRVHQRPDIWARRHDVKGLTVKSSSPAISQRPGLRIDRVEVLPPSAPAAPTSAARTEPAWPEDIWPPR